MFVNESLKKQKYAVKSLKNKMLRSKEIKTEI